MVAPLVVEHMMVGAPLAVAHMTVVALWVVEHMTSVGPYMTPVKAVVVKPFGY